MSPVAGRACALRRKKLKKVRGQRDGSVGRLRHGGAHSLRRKSPRRGRSPALPAAATAVAAATAAQAANRLLAPIDLLHGGAAVTQLALSPEVSECRRCRSCRCGVDAVSMRCRLTLVSIVSMCVDRVESVSEGRFTRETRVLCQPVSECRVLECQACRVSEHVERVEGVECSSQSCQVGDYVKQCQDVWTTVSRKHQIHK